MTREDDTRHALYSVGRAWNGGYFRLKDQHGTASCYRAGCRCIDCRRASAEARRNARARQRIQSEPNDSIAQDQRGRWRRGDYHVIPIFERADWTDRAACRNKDTSDWYPDKGGNTATAYIRARDICNRCTVVDDCLVYALKNRERFGLWGGIPERARRPLEHLTEAEAIAAGQKIRDAWTPKRRSR